MTKINVWEIVKKEAETIINAIENRDVHTLTEIKCYLDSAYSWDVSTKVMTIVNVYTSLNNIELPWDNE